SAPIRTRRSRNSNAAGLWARASGWPSRCCSTPDSAAAKLGLPFSPRQVATRRGPLQPRRGRALLAVARWHSLLKAIVTHYWWTARPRRRYCRSHWMGSTDLLLLFLCPADRKALARTAVLCHRLPGWAERPLWGSHWLPPSGGFADYPWSPSCCCSARR